MTDRKPEGFLDNDCEMNIDENMCKLLDKIGEGGGAGGNTGSSDIPSYRLSEFEDTTRFTPVPCTTTYEATWNFPSETGNTIHSVLSDKTVNTEIIAQLLETWSMKKKIYVVISNIIDDSIDAGSNNALRDCLPLCCHITLAPVYKTASGYVVKTGNSDTQEFKIQLLPQAKFSTNNRYNLVFVLDNRDDKLDMYGLPLYAGQDFKLNNKSITNEYITCEGKSTYISHDIEPTSNFAGMMIYKMDFGFCQLAYDDTAHSPANVDYNVQAYVDAE